MPGENMFMNVLRKSSKYIDFIQLFEQINNPTRISTIVKEDLINEDMLSSASSS